MKLCPHCSASIEDDAAKCPKCGRWVVQVREGPVKQKGKENWKHLVLLGVLALAAWALWAWPEVGVRPREILDFQSDTNAALRAIRSDLEQLERLQEAHFRDHGEYSGNPEVLGFEASEGVTVSLIGRPEGWSGAATHQDHPGKTGCAIFVGSAVPPPVTSNPLPAQPNRMHRRGAGINPPPLIPSLSWSPLSSPSAVFQNLPDPLGQLIH